LFPLSVDSPDRRFRVVPLRLHPAPSGAASVATRQRVDQVIEKVTREDSRISLSFISVDGNEGYNEYFERGFNQVVDFIEDGKFGIESRHFVLSIRLFWLSDWLHHVKSASVKLFGREIAVTLQYVSGGATKDGISGSFAKSPTFTNNSPLGKMRDCYPFDLFALQRAHILFVHRNNVDEFLYVFIMGLWSEAFESRHFPRGTRILIFETLLHCLYVQYTLIIQGKTNSAVTQKKSKRNGCLTCVSRKKLQRFGCTLSAQLTRFLIEGPNLGMEQIGSHSEENFIGSVRPICHGHNRHDNV
jgi:hypothetical protein